MALPDTFDGRPTTLDGPSGFAATITPNDATRIAPPRALWVGTTGNLTLTMRTLADPPTDVDVVLKNIPSGTLLPVRPYIVKATGTTAADIVALY